MGDFFLLILALLLTIAVGWCVKLYTGSKKDKALLREEIKYELLYLYLGLKSITEDFFRVFHNKTDLPQKPDHIIVITGGLRGIGLEVIRMLLECDVHIIVGCREVDKGVHFANKMRMEGSQFGKMYFKQLDLTSMDSIRDFAKTIREGYPKINVLINNAAIMYVPYAKTVDGFESQMATNYLGHVLLTHLLLDNMAAAGTEEDPSRIVNVGSVAHEVGVINYDDINSENNYVALKTYAQTKLALLWFSMHINELLKERNLWIESYVVHPGVSNTALFADTVLRKITPWMLSMVLKEPEKGATPIVFCAISPLAKKLAGGYVSNCVKKVTEATKASKEEKEKLFQYTMKLLKIKEFGKV